MNYDPRSGEICIYKGDYGVPIAYDAVGFAIEDEIVFVVSGNIITPKIFFVDELDDDDNFHFNLRFTESEARAIVAEAGSRCVHYSFKHYRAGVLIDTIANGRIKVKETVEWQN